MTGIRPRIAIIVGSARPVPIGDQLGAEIARVDEALSLIHISEPTRPY